jgi:hypothetical protein
MPRKTNDPVKAINLDNLTSHQLSQLSRRCLATRKAINERARTVRNAQRQKNLAARKAKLEKQLAAASS